MLMSMFIGASTIELGQSLMTLVSFAILVYFIHRFAWKPIMSILDERADRIEKDLTTAKDKSEQSQKLSQEAEEAIVNAQIEASNIIEEAKAQANPVKEQIINQAREEARKIKADAKIEVEQQRQRAATEMKTEVTDIAVAIADKILQREINADDQQRLIEEFIEGLAVESHEE